MLSSITRACSRITALPTRGSRLMSTAAANSAAQIDFSKLVVEHNKNPREKDPYETLKFGYTFTDHMFEVDWSQKSGWKEPKIRPFGNLSIHPAASSLHYALQCFEGMKAYIDAEGNARLFRPEMNMKRLNTSAKRLLLPTIDTEQSLLCLKELVKIDKSWIPKRDGYSLYIRPTLISTTNFLGVAPASEAKFYIICSPVGPYYPTGFAPVKLLADPKYVRAWPGGTGHVKCGGNYAAGIAPQREAADKGYQQLLWLFGEDHQVTEVGTMNQFWYWHTKSGEKELVTAPLDGTILPGVTRDSVIQLARSWGINVREEKYTMSDITEAVKDGRMIEAFGTGTAAIVSPVCAVGFNGTDYQIPLDKEDPSAKAGKLTTKIMNSIQDIQYGRVPHPWSVVV